MATRQNKKRKGRQNVNNRERTVTTLTEDPHTAFLVPTPSEDPPTAHSIPPHYTANSSSSANSNTQNQQSYSQMEVRNPAFSAFPSYSDSNYLTSMHNFTAPGSQQQQQDDHQYIRYSSDSNLPPGQNDLEVLEKLKETIKNGQHEFFRAVPQPSALAKVYLGFASSPYNASMSSQVPPHPDQVPSPQNGTAHGPKNGSVSTPSAPSGGDYLRKGRNHSMSIDSWDGSATRNKLISPPANYQVPPSQPQAHRFENSSNGNSIKSFPPSGPSAVSKSHNDMRGPVDLKSSNSSRDTFSDIGPRNSFGRPPAQPATVPRLDQVGDLGYGRKGSADTKSSNDGKEDLRQRDPWPQRHGQVSQDDRLSKPPLDVSDRSPRTGSLDTGRPSDRSYFDRDRERDRDKDRERDNHRDRSRDSNNRRYDRFDRRMDDRPRIIDNRRPPLDQRHWEPSRRPFEHGAVLDKRPDSDPTRAVTERPGGVSDDRQSRPLDDRIPSARVSETRHETTDERRSLISSSPSAGNDARRPPLGPSSSTEDRSGRQTVSGLPSNSSATGEDSIARNTLEDRATRPQLPPGPKEDRKPVPLEDRISRVPQPSLQDRLSQPQINDTRTANRLPPTGPSLEERLSQPSNTQDNNRGGRPPATPDDRNYRQGPGFSAANDRITRPADTNRSLAGGGSSPDGRQPAATTSRPPAEERGRPTERFSLPIGPVEDRKAHSNAPPSRPNVYTPSSSTSNARAQSVTRDEVSIRDYRSGGPGIARAISVSREPVTPATESRPSPHRPNSDRFGGDSRRPDLVEIDRYTDNRSQPAYHRTPSIPPQHQHQPMDSRDRAVWDRQRWSSPPPGRNEPYAEDTRFRPAYQQGQWADYDSRPRGWEEKDRQWEQNDRWGDRRFIERDAVPASGSAGWETLQEHEQRRASFGSSERAGTGGFHSRPLSSRLTDAYTVPEDRGYASDLDPPTLYPSSTAVGTGADPTSPPFSRIRQRSPSPAARDLLRPPMKRPREEYTATSDYYSPHAPGAVAPVVGAAEYPPRMASPATSASAPGYYERPPQPGVYAGAGVSGGAGAVTRDRDYPGPRESYQTSTPYDRRMPPPRTSYQRGTYVSDDRRFGPGISRS